MQESPVDRALEILGLSRGVTYDEAKTAYRKYASKHHLDRHMKKPEGERKRMEEELKNLNEVWPKLETHLLLLEQAEQSRADDAASRTRV